MAIFTLNAKGWEFIFSSQIKLAYQEATYCTLDQAAAADAVKFERKMNTAFNRVTLKMEAE